MTSQPSALELIAAMEIVDKRKEVPIKISLQDLLARFSQTEFREIYEFLDNNPALILNENYKFKFDSINLENCELLDKYGLIRGEIVELDTDGNKDFIVPVQAIFYEQKGQENLGPNYLTNFEKTIDEGITFGRLGSEKRISSSLLAGINRDKNKFIYVCSVTYLAYLAEIKLLL